MHIFLTGQIQIGKSTVIQKTIKLLDINCGGFRTYFGEDRNLKNRALYINSANEENAFDEKNVIVQFKEGQAPIVDVQKFNIYGSKLIRDSRNKADLILMDECGSLECEAYEFQDEIINTLNGQKPILGVVKLASKGWTDAIRNHPNVKMITVTKENRDYLPEKLKEIFYEK